VVNTIVLLKLKFFSPTNAHLYYTCKTLKCTVKINKHEIFVGEKNFSVIKMHGTTIKNSCTILST
jgi:hypothetical protein